MIKQLYAMDCLSQLKMLFSVVGLGWCFKAYPEAKLTQRSWSLFCGLLSLWCNTAFWTLGRPLHLRNMLNKLMRSNKLCNLQVILVNRTGPILSYKNAKPYILQPVIQKLDKLCFRVLHYQWYSPELWSMDCQCHFHGKGFQGWVRSRNMFILHEYKTYFILAIMCWL